MESTNNYKTFEKIAENMGFKIQHQTENPPKNKDTLLITKNNKNCLFFLSEFTETKFANTLQKL